MTVLIIIIGVVCCFPLFSFIVLGIKGAVEVREAKQRCFLLFAPQKRR